MLPALAGIGLILVIIGLTAIAKAYGPLIRGPFFKFHLGFGVILLFVGGIILVLGAISFYA